MSRHVEVAAVWLILTLVLASFSSSSVVDPSKRTGPRILFKNFIGDNGRIYACSDKDFFSFERDGTISWRVHLNYTCNAHIAPVHGGSRMIYVVAEKRVLKIYPSRVGTSEPPVEVFFGPAQGSDEIVGVSASLSSSCVLVNVKHRGLFAFRLHGQLMWSAGPVLYRHGYRQGCKKNSTECYFTSSPAIDHCEATVFISNSIGELYSVSLRGPYFNWIKDLSSYGNTFVVTPGNNGRLYVTVPETGVILALDVLTGRVLWHGSIGPLRSQDYEPSIDANGWIWYGSLDGFLYSFSPSGDLEKFPQPGGLNSVIQVNPILDCSGYAIYISRTEMEGKESRDIADYIYVSALKPKGVVFTLLDLASGYIYPSESDPGKLLLNLSRSDLRDFAIDEQTLLAFFAVSRIGNPLPCRSTRVKLASSCSRGKPEHINIYTDDGRTLTLFVLFESIVLAILAAVVWYCCIFWKKKKVRCLDLGKFLQNRRSLQFRKKAFDKMIEELEQKFASDDTISNVDLAKKLAELAKERDDIQRKLSTTYSLGRDEERSFSSFVLPLHDPKGKSFALRGSEEGNVAIFDVSSSSTDTGDGESSEFSGDGEFSNAGEGMVERDDASSEGCVKLKHSCGEIEEVMKLDGNGDDDDDDDNDDIDDNGDGDMVNMKGGSRSLRRRIVSFTN